MHRRMLSGLLLLGLPIGACNCGDDPAPGPIIYVYPDSGVDDGDSRDAQRPDVSLVDSGGPPPPTGMPEEGLVGNCAVDSNKIFELASVNLAPAVTPLAVDRTQSRFGYAYVDEGAGCGDVLMLATAQGSPQALEAPMRDATVDVCSLIDSPAVEHAEDDFWLLAFVDNREGYGVWVHRFDYHDGSIDDGHKLSAADGRKGNVSIARVSDERAIVAWTENQPGGEQTLKARAIDLTGAPIGDEQVIVEGGELSSVMIALLGTGADGLPDPTVGIVYRHATGTATRAELQVLDMDATPTSSPIVFTEAPGDLGSVAISHNRYQEFARDEAAGAIVFAMTVSGSGRQLWLQLIDETGAPSELLDPVGRPRGPAPAKRLVNAPSRGLDASITRMPTGYAVAYRALPGGAVERPTIRVLFLDRFGEIVGSSDVGYTTEFGGVTSIKVGADGRTVVGWSEYDDEGNAIVKIARLPCTG